MVSLCTDSFRRQLVSDVVWIVVCYHDSRGRETIEYRRKQHSRSVPPTRSRLAVYAANLQKAKL
jgi:hypothetical protein